MGYGIAVPFLRHSSASLTIRPSGRLRRRSTQASAPMNSFTPLFAMIAGMFLSMLWLSFSLLWLRVLFGFRKKSQPTVSGAPSAYQYAWVLVLLLINPAPWLLIFTPFAAYRILSNPHIPQWVWFFLGTLIGPTVWIYSVVKGLARYKRIKAAKNSP
jgi:hypothetical protein